jgi:hypothetical protein
MACYSWSWSLSWCQAPIWSPWPDICFLSDDCEFSVLGHPLWREDGSIIVQLLLGLARAVTLGSKSRRTHSHILPSHLRFLQFGGPGPRNYIPQEQGGPVIPPGTGLFFCRGNFTSLYTPSIKLGLINYKIKTSFATASKTCLISCF